MLLEGFRERTFGALPDPEGFRYGGGNQLRVAYGGERHEEDARVELVQQIGRNLQPQARLARPPAPVSVSSRTSGRRRRPAISESFFSRPTSEVSCVGRLFILASRVFKGGKLVGRSGERSWKTLSGLKRSLRRFCPRSLKDAPSGRSSRVSSCVVCESRICPPWPAESSLATLLRGGPK